MLDQFQIYIEKVESFPTKRLMLCLSVCLVCYCPHCLPPTSEGQAGNKEQETDKQSIKFREEALICCKEKKLLPHLMHGVTFHNKMKHSKLIFKCLYFYPGNFEINTKHLLS